MKMISVSAARSALATYDTPLPTETVALAAAPGRVLAEPVVADRPQPPFDRVAMDGIAINYAAYAAGERVFPIVGVQAAGAPARRLVDAATCREVMTGAVLPTGTTTVVRYEDLTREGGTFRLPEGVVDGKNIHRRGKDAAPGAILCPPGRVIGPTEMGALATCGYARVEVRVRPRVAVVSTGDELVRVGEEPLAHQIRRSNGWQLKALFERLPVTVTLHHFADDEDQLRAGLAEILADTDFLFLTGGVSKGKYDYVPGVLTDLGVQNYFHRVAQKPGKPLWAGRRGECLVLGLPGNPGSALCCAVQYGVPAVRRALGLPERTPRYAVLTEDVVFKPDLTLFQLVAVHSEAKTGRLLATPVRNAGSGDLPSLVRGDGWVEIEGGGVEMLAVRRYWGIV